MAQPVSPNDAASAEVWARATASSVSFEDAASPGIDAILGGECLAAQPSVPSSPSAATARVGSLLTSSPALLAAALAASQPHSRKRSITTAAVVAAEASAEQSSPRLLPGCSAPQLVPHRKRVHVSHASSDEDTYDAQCEGFVPPHLLSTFSDAGPLDGGAGAQLFQPGSVLEGAGRSLRGLDAIRVRTAVMRQTGFLEPEVAAQ